MVAAHIENFKARKILFIPENLNIVEFVIAKHQSPQFGKFENGGRYLKYFIR